MERRDLEEQDHIIDITKQSQANQSQRRRNETFSDLPFFNPRSVPGKRESNLRSRSSKKLIHAIPVLVFLCLFALWWFSYPVDLEIKDGRTIAVLHQIEKRNPIDELESKVDLTILALANPPNLDAPLILPANNHTELQPSKGQEN